MDILGIKKLKAQAQALEVQLKQQNERIEKEAWELEQEYTNKQNEVELHEKAKANLLASFANFNTQIFPHYETVKGELIFQILDDVYSVVSRLASTAAMIPFYGEQKNGDDIKPNDKLQAFIDTLTFAEKEKYYTTAFLMGEMFGYKEKIDFGVNKGLRRLMQMNPAQMIVVISETFPVEIVGYRYYDSLHGFNVDFDASNMMYDHTYNPTIDTFKSFRGLSPIEVLKKRITRTEANLDTSIAQMQNGGLPGVVYPKQLGIEPGAAGQQKDNFARYLNNSSNKGAPYFAGIELGYFAIGSTLADMDLAELAQVDFDKICNVFGVSSVLFNKSDASTESNVKEMVKAMYTNAVLPMVIRFQDAINLQVVPDIDTKAIVQYDISDINELQDDMKAKAEGYAASPIMIPNNVLEGLGQKRVEGDESMNKPWVKSGYTLVEDAAAPPEPLLPDTAGDYTPPVKPKPNEK